jgi:hypothetical protein
VLPRDGGRMFVEEIVMADRDRGFLYEILACRGFGPKIIQMIKQVTQRGSVGIKINYVEGDFSLTGKGLRQWAPWHLSCLILDKKFNAIFVCMYVSMRTNSVPKYGCSLRPYG